jgi:hypothetical protein
MSARAYIVAMFPQGPRPFAHPSGNLEEALTLVHSYQISSVGSFPFLSALLFSAVLLFLFSIGVDLLDADSCQKGFSAYICHFSLVSCCGTMSCSTGQSVGISVLGRPSLGGIDAPPSSRHYLVAR